MKGIIGRKLGMSQIFAGDGRAVPVTLVEAGPCYITQLKTEETDGYAAIQLGFGEAKEKALSKARRGHLAKAGAPLLKYLAEVRIEDTAELGVGQEIAADVFTEGELVDVIGVSKGKGTAGVMKRHNYHGRPASHGHHFHRAPGAIGMCATPSRVWKGKKMPGRMGNNRTTISFVEVVKVDKVSNLIALKGNVPGPKGGLVMIRAAKRSRV
ncbi:MAG: 50S ribosomal protein L3 [Actinomycetota bacterium]